MRKDNLFIWNFGLAYKKSAILPQFFFFWTVFETRSETRLCKNGPFTGQKWPG